MTSPLVQETSGSSTTTSLTLTFGSAATLNNCIVIAVSGFKAGTISGITLGGTGSLFSQASATGSTSNNAQVWFCTPVSVSSTTIVITASVAGVIAYAYEIAGYLPYGLSNPGRSSAWPDQSEWSFNTGTSWSSAATATTLNAAEFVVGIGSSTGTGSVTVTGPGSGGWTNETAINGVHAGSEFYSAVSGYQVQSTTGTTYDYSGSVSGSAAWGAVTATFLLMPNFGNWGGYIFNEHSSYTGVSATFTVPSLTGETGSSASIWVGMDGPSSGSSVYQCGITLDYDTSVTGNTYALCWSEWVPGPFENWDPAAYPVKAGDSLTLTVQLTTTDWLMTIANNTEAWSYTEVKSVLSVNIGQLENEPSGPAYWPFPLMTAEVIIEDQGPTLPDYGSVAFTSVTTTPAIAGAPVPYATVNTLIDQYPGPFSGGAFTMYWNGYT